MSSKEFSVLDKAGAISDSIVELHCALIGFVCRPVHPGRTATSRFRINMLDQRAANAATTRIVRNEQVLNIAVVLQRPGGSMGDKMHKPKYLFSCRGKRRIHRLGRVALDLLALAMDELKSAISGTLPVSGTSRNSTPWIVSLAVMCT